jgi:hypothetical protein
MAINNNEGPRLEDPGVIAQRMMGSGSSGDDNDKNQFEAIADGLATMVSRLLGKATGIKIRLRTLGSTGLFKQFTPAQTWSGKSVNEGAPTLAAKGGMLSTIAQKASFTKLDFSKIASPAIEGFPVQSMSYASLGNLAPMDSGGGGRGSIGLG